MRLAALLLSVAFCSEAFPVPPDPAGPVPVVFNATRSARPGDLVSLQGEHFGPRPEVWLDRPGTPPLQLPLENSVGSGWVAVRIPPDARGALIVRVRNGEGSSPAVLLNQAVPLHLDTLQIAAGGAFRVFGCNLLLPGSTPVVTVNGKPAAIDLANSDDTMLIAVAPADLVAAPAAALTVDNGNGSGPADLHRPVTVIAGEGGDPFQVGVGWTAALPRPGELFYRAGVAADGVKDDSAAIQEAIDKAARDSEGSVVQIPEGTCRISHPVTLRSGVVLQGAGRDQTILRYDVSNYPVWASHADRIGLRNLSLVNGGKDVEGPLLKGNTRVLIQNVRFDLGVSQQIYLSENRNIVVTGCEFLQGGSLHGQGPYQLSKSAGLVFTHNKTVWKDGAPSFQESHDSYIANNTWTRDASVQNTPIITTHCCVIDFCHRIAVVGNRFGVVNGPVTNRDRNDGETLLTEGGGGHRTENLGSVAQASELTLTDPANTIDVHPFDRESIPENYGVAIVDGKGAGQTRRVTGLASKTLSVDRRWDVIPDATSRYATFVWGLEKSLLKGNRLTGNSRGIWLYQCAIRDVDVLGNTLEEGGGIFLRTWQSVAEKQFTPIYNVRIAGNTVSNTTGLWASHIGSVFVTKEARPFGIGQIGLEIRDNRLTANPKNLQLGAEDYASIEGIYVLLKPEVATYEAPALAPFLGTILERNTCTHCDVAFRLGTGAEGTILSANQTVRCQTVWTDTPALTGAPGSRNTVVQ
ncbi:MAG TPA: glycosyl hydrolase family 28-related protein [Planctomycetota bacterium]|nr:glycosyl hydrolase family 28-related protein [Planctomycetota bacterium]